MNNKGILIFNQSGSDLSLISAMLEAEDCTVFVTSLPLEAIHILKNNDIDVILAAAQLEGMDGREFKELAERIKPGVSIFLLPLAAREGIRQTGNSGACTVNLQEFVQFIQNHIRTESRVVSEAAKFKDFFFAFTDRLLQLFEVNDNYFFNNNHLVAEHSIRIANSMALDEKLVDAIHLAALLRDIGKIGIQQEILNHRDRLEKDAFNLIKCHPLNTVQLLRQINFPWNVESIISHHHEHYDGNGYPDGLKGRNIPLGSRIIAIADSYVAMTTDRSYRKALSKDAAVREIMKMAGSQFDPELVEIFFALLQTDQSSVADRKQILVIDRDEAVSAFIKLNLGSEDYDIFLAARTVDALYYLNETIPYVIIADTELMEEEMKDLWILLRENRSTAGIPFIMIVPCEDYPLPVTRAVVDFIVKPLDIDLLAAKINHLGGGNLAKNGAAEPAEEMKGVSGNLEDMGITDIIQVLNMGLKTARITLASEGRHADIYLKNGKVVNVSLGELSGKEAFFEMIDWDKGVFHIFHGQICAEENITMETMSLLLEASKSLDEKRYARK